MAEKTFKDRVFNVFISSKKKLDKERKENTIDYKKLSHYIFNICKLHDISSILNESSECLNNLLDYELFGFILKENEKLNIWIDPKIYEDQFLNAIEKEFPHQYIDCSINYISKKRTKSQEKIDTASLISFAVTEDRCLAKLYIYPKQRTLKFHNEIIDTIEIVNIIVKAIDIAIKNSILIKELKGTGTLDPLTGCYNLRALNFYIEHDLANVKRYGSGLSVILYDIDHLKAVNDRYGYYAGDAVLKEVSKAVLSSVRKSDYIARYKAEEFLIVLPDTGLLHALEMAERLRRLIESKKIVVDSKVISVTSSFGVADFNTIIDKEKLFKKAAEALP
ncbi:diguanylate cyclase [Candidatus Magnetoovum chiemensis]|nr:diguanylate cyclase [Candidatus Magnetoovum chiemensis]